MPNLVEKKQCCGCAACANKCSKSAIEMKPDDTGFLFPVINKELCVECGLCEKACPALNPAKRDNNYLKTFIVQHKNEQIRYQSTSGGAFTAIAEKVIDEGGVVFGASISKDFDVQHIFVESKDELIKFRNSKYVQSKIGRAYKDTLSFLKEGRLVCFSGTPCQLNGLHKFLGKDYDNLISVDVCCRSVPSPLVFQKYVDFKRKQIEDANLLVFRDKKRGYSYCTLAWYKNEFNKEKGLSEYRRSSESDEWLRLFLGGYCDRNSCYSCKYQSTQRISDFTLWDCWETRSLAPEWNDNKGTTNVAVWTEKGLKFFEKLDGAIRFREFDPQKAQRGLERNSTLKPSKNREQFFKDANELSSEDFIKKYVPFTIKVKLKMVGRYVIWRTHLHNLIRRIKHFIIHRK